MLPFENLTGDSALDWVSGAVSTMVSTEISGSTRLAVVTVARAGDAALRNASEIVQGYYELRAGRIRFHGAVFDNATQRAIKTVDATADPRDLAGAIDSMGHQLSDATRPASTRNPDALRAWGEALMAGDLDTRIAALGRAIQADANFGGAYAELAVLYKATGRSAEAATTIENARLHTSAMGELDRARIELTDAELKGDTSRRRQAMFALSRLFPTDTDALRRLSDMDRARRDYAASAESLRAALAVTPDNEAMWNSLGYVEAYRGNLDAAREALERYRALLPDQWNPDDSLGEVHFYLGRFKEAEKYFLDASKHAPPGMVPVEVGKAAQSRMMQGDLAGADALFAQSLGVAANTPVGMIRKAQWLYLTGRRTEALAVLAPLTSQAVGAYANAQIAIWDVSRHERQGAGEAAARCIAMAAGSPLADVCRMLADPTAQVPVTALGEFTTVYRPLLAGNYAAALPELKGLYEKTGPDSDSKIRVLYAWALIETGHVEEAAPLVALYPMPMSGGDMLFGSLEFPRYLALRATVLRKQGKQAEADSADALYRKLGGQ